MSTRSNFRLSIRGCRLPLGRPPLHGFTLVELLVVITIIGILIALLLPAVQAAREAARRMQCANNFKQVGLALHNYHSSKQCFPVGVFDPTSVSHAPGWWSWSTYILPFMEQDAVYNMIDFNTLDYFGGYGAEMNPTRRANGTFIAEYLCPSDPQGAELVCSAGAGSVGQNSMEDSARTNITGVADSVAFLPIGRLTYPYRQYPEVDGVFGANEAFLGELDFLVLSMPLTPRTEGIVGETELRSLRPIAYLRANYGRAFLEETFRRMARDVYRAIGNDLKQGNQEHLVEHWTYYFDREGGQYTLERKDDAIHFVVHQCLS